MTNERGYSTRCHVSKAAIGDPPEVLALTASRCLTANSAGNCCLMSLEAKKMPSKYSHLLCTSTHASSTALSLVNRSSHNAASSWNSCTQANRMTHSRRTRMPRVKFDRRRRDTHHYMTTPDNVIGRNDLALDSTPPLGKFISPSLQVHTTPGVS